ncbi:type II toxin-antitoxin system VapC family toxin [Micromonospora chalcea]|uniref:type II toxin-antitoxin system VapC family toxin n=1 Tax=Micromonospora sp. TSRI0369 TaxID=1703936 RepID=UPI00093A8A23|nr:type II toxin-antitoxin system VapC family toxin [Micromonospora sp. TSRI0369]OKJ46404.1 DNA-binding protein [Micromonospora sp. TSRI0369]
MASERIRAVAGRANDTVATLVDTNVLLDIFTDDPKWADWSSEALAAARDAGLLVINPIVYAEVSVRFARVEDLDDALPASDFLREELPYPAGFLAGKAYARYRSRGGAKGSPIADFYIGAHAAVCHYRLLTRDSSRYRSYFPGLTLIAPDD